MKECFCPECGVGINDKFYISIAGLFRGVNKWAIFTMLHDGVSPDWMKVLECNEFECVRHFKEMAEECFPEQSPISIGERSVSMQTLRNRQRSTESTVTEIVDEFPSKQDFASEIGSFSAGEQPTLMRTPRKRQRSTESILSDSVVDVRKAEEVTRAEMEAQYKDDKLVAAYIKHLPSEEEALVIESSLGYKMDLTHPYSENCRKYVWIDIIIEQLRSELEGDPRIVPYLLSTVYQDDDEWYNMDIKACLQPERVTEVVNALMPLIPSNILQNQVLSVNRVQRIINTAQSFCLNFNCGAKTWKTITRDDTGKYPVEFTFGPFNESLYMRICPHCGAHIPSLLGIYEQRIISFIGTPASGKSSMINAIYSLLHIGEPHPHVTATIKSCEPHWDVYEQAYNLMKIERLAVKKTDMGYYPSLTLLIEYKDNKVLYTFVDVPGEHFIFKEKVNEYETATSEEKNNANMHRLNIMKHSKVICAVIAAEQLLPLKQRYRAAGHSMAGGEPLILNSFVERVSQLRTQIGEKMPPVFFIISKIDAFPHTTNSDFTKHEEYGENYELWAYCDNNPNEQVTKEDINELYNLLMTSEILLEGNSKSAKRAVVKNVVNFNMLFRQQELAHKLVRNMEGKPLLESLAQALINTPDWEQIPLFMISPFGFYALENVFQMSEEEKIQILRENNRTNNVDDNKLKKLAEIIKPDLLLESFDAPEESEIHQIQKEYNLTRNDITQILLAAYRDQHRNDRPYGVEQFVGWLMSFTGLYDYVYIPENAASSDVVQKNRKRCDSLRQYLPELSKIEARYVDRLRELVERKWEYSRIYNEKEQEYINTKWWRFIKKIKTEKERDDAKIKVDEVEKEIKHCKGSDSFTKNNIF